jgi:guanine deaminase
MWFYALHQLSLNHVAIQHGLLTSRTVQAHCTFLSTPNLTHLSTLGTSIAHCPLSNAYFSDEPFHLREALTQGVKVGLGTDVAGGYSLDIMNAMRHAVAVSKIREGARALSSRAENTNETVRSPPEQNLAIDWKESIYLATQGGAHALGLTLGSGNFEVGAPFDAQQSKSIAQYFHLMLSGACNII